MTIQEAKVFFKIESKKDVDKITVQDKPRAAVLIQSADKTQITFEGIDGKLKPIRLLGKGINKKYNRPNRMYD